MPKCDFNKVALQLYWNHTSAWVFSCKFAAYFQNNFSQEHLWVAASVDYKHYTRATQSFNQDIVNELFKLFITLHKKKKTCYLFIYENPGGFGMG